MRSPRLVARIGLLGGLRGHAGAHHAPGRGVASRNNTRLDFAAPRRFRIGSARVPDEQRRRWRWLESRRIVLFATLLGVALAAPSLFGGWQVEDYGWQRLETSPATVLLKDFFPVSDPVLENYAAKDTGYLPWISVRDLRVSLWRPLTRVTHYVDYKLWPGSALLMHAQSLAWFALLLVAVALLYRRIEGASWVAGLAAVLYAVDSGHGPALGWLANRNAIVASAFAVLALVAQDRWRRGGKRWGAALAPLCILLGLASSELAVGVLGYLVAYALVLDPASWRRRVAACLPWATVVGLWALYTRALGYGAHGSGAYIDPVASPLAFARAAITRLPTLLFGVLGVAPIDLKAFLDMRWPIYLLVPGLAFLGLAIAMLFQQLRADRTARFWALGMLLSLVPACGTFPADRLLVLASVGAAALIAKLIATASTRPARFVAGAWVVTHLWLSALLLPARSLGLMFLDRTMGRMSDQAFEGVTSRAERVVIVNTPDLYTGAMMIQRRKVLGQPTTEHAWVMYGGTDAVRVTRESRYDLLVHPEHGFLSMPFDRVYRGAAFPMHPGQGLQLSGVQIIVVAVDATGTPTDVRFRFAWALDDARRLRIVAWNGARYAPLALPPIGGSVVVPAVHLRF